MSSVKADIIARLRKEISTLEGYKPRKNDVAETGLGSLLAAFPGAVFPTGVIHEFICPGPEDAAATNGFVAAVLSGLTRKGGVTCWIGASVPIFPPALALFGMDPDRVIFLQLSREKDIQWAIEEALKCDALTAVVGFVRTLDFTISRRWQLATEKSRVTGFLLGPPVAMKTQTAGAARWKISPLPSLLPANMPGVGFPSWQIELLKVRNGKPGTWERTWEAGTFCSYVRETAADPDLRRKTG